MTTNHGTGREQGISMRTANLIMAAAIVLISIGLLEATFRVNRGYSKMRINTENYMLWQVSAHDLQDASDYLTEQVRCYTVTGEREYLDNYFEEANVTRRRDKAVENLRGFMGDTPAYRALVAAMEESVSLMEREYYAMRLMIAAKGSDAGQYPEKVQNVSLTPADAALTSPQQEALARSMVFDDYYRQKKQAISSNMGACLRALAEDIDGQQTATADDLNMILSRQRLLIILTIAITMALLLMTLLLDVKPLLRAGALIREGKPLSVKGSREFKFLASSYNQMFDVNAQQKEELAYEATHDKLTGVYNRNGYDSILKGIRWDTSALVLFDVDRFKPVNDQFGHKTGDLVLARVAKAIQNAFRAQDYVCRIGGDEFAVIMINTSVTSSDLIRGKVDRINEALCETDENGVPGVYVSCGAIYGAKTQDYDRLFHEADAALYRVKNSGGGGCEICE